MFYRVMKAIITVLSFVIMPVRVYGKEKLDREGGYILACNHQSFMDIPAIVIANKRCVRFMAKASLYKNGFIKWIFGKMGAFPVDTSSVDIHAVRNAMKVIKSGEVLGIFPQGTREKSPIVKREQILSGTAFVALQTGAAIIPCVFDSKPLLFKRCRLYVGDAIEPDGYNRKRITQEALAEVSQKIYNSMDGLMPDAVKEKYADENNNC